MMKHRANAVMVSVDYADFLLHTLPQNKGFFNRTIVVTTPQDLDTQKVCKANGVECVLSERIHEDSHVFNKGKGLNDGIATLNNSDWIVSLDADIYLPDDFDIRMFQDINFIYLMNRIVIETEDQFNLWRSTGIFVSEKPPQFAGSGFFHAFHPHSPNMSKEYFSEFFQNASVVDIDFLDRWPECFRHVLNCVCYHLGQPGKNWEGRVTRRFSPDRLKRVRPKLVCGSTLLQSV